MPIKNDYIEMKLPASAEYVSLIRLTLSGVFSRAGASYDDIEDSKIAVSEAVTNAVKHAYKNDETNGMINLCFELFDDKIKIVISDIEMKLPASAEYVSLIRLTLSGVFSRAGASYDDIEDSKIAVSEAVTNAVKHAYKMMKQMV